MKPKTIWIVKIGASFMLLVGASLTGMASCLPDSIAILIGSTGVLISVFSIIWFLVALNYEEK